MLKIQHLNSKMADEGTESIQNENAFHDEMPLYPENYDAKRTVHTLKFFLIIVRLHTGHFFFCERLILQCVKV